MKFYENEEKTLEEKITALISEETERAEEYRQSDNVIEDIDYIFNELADDCALIDHLLALLKNPGYGLDVIKVHIRSIAEAAIKIAAIAEERNQQ